MIVDEAGVLWLSNPLVALAMVTGAVALVFWCHRWLETGSAPMPRMAVRDRVEVRKARLLREKATGSVIRLNQARPAPLHAIRTVGRPRSAA